MSFAPRPTSDRRRVTVSNPVLKAVWVALICCAPPPGFADDVPVEPSIDRWIGQLQSDSFIQRDFAMRRLAELGEPVVPQLAATVSCNDEQAISAALRLLERLARDDGQTGETAHRALAELCHGDSRLLDAVRHRARMALLRVDRRIVGMVAALGGSIERDAELRIVSVQVNDRAFGDHHAQLLARFISLVRLDLRDTSVTDQSLDALTKLPALETLNLSDTAVTAKGLRELAPLKSLKQLSVYRIRLSAEDQVWFREHLPNCQLRD